MAPFLESLPVERAVLIPCADDWVRAVASLPLALRERFPSCVAEPATVDALQDKGHLAEVLQDLGVPHPTTVVVSDRRDLEKLPDEVFARAFLKPRDSLSFGRRFGTKAFRVRDKADALARFAELQAAGHPVVLQQFLPGQTEDHYFLEGFVDNEGRVCARFARQRLRMWPPDFGQSSYTVSVPLARVSEAVKALGRLFARVRYRGIYCAEFMRDPHDGGFRLLEVNLRPYVHVEFASFCGVDLPWMAYRDALGLPVEEVAGYEVGRRCIDLERDLPAAAHLIAGGELGALSWLRSCIGADGLAFAWDDPAPGVHRLATYLWGLF